MVNVMLESVEEVMDELASLWRKRARRQDVATDPEVEVETRHMPDQLTVKVFQDDPFDTPSNAPMKGGTPTRHVRLDVFAPRQDDNLLKFIITGDRISGDWRGSFHVDEKVYFSPSLNDPKDTAQDIFNEMYNALSDSRVYVASDLETSGAARRGAQQRCASCGRTEPGQLARAYSKRGRYTRHVRRRASDAGRSRRKSSRVTADQLQEIMDDYERLPEDEAQRLADRINRGSDPSAIMQDADDLLDGHGVEAIRDHDAYDPYWGKIVAEYVNMGDMYWPTLWYDVERDEFTVTDWATYMQKLEARYDNLTQR